MKDDPNLKDHVSNSTFKYRPDNETIPHNTKNYVYKYYNIQFIMIYQELRQHRTSDCVLLKLLTVLHTVFQGCRRNLSSCVCFLVPTSVHYHIYRVQLTSDQTPKM